MTELKEYISDLETIEKYAESLTPQALFIAGVSYIKSGIPSGSILRYLAFTQKIHDEEILNSTNKSIIEFHFYKGEINEAKKILKNYKRKPQPKDPQSENIGTLTNTVENVKDPMINNPPVLPLVPESQPNASLNTTQKTITKDPLQSAERPNEPIKNPTEANQKPFQPPHSKAASNPRVIEKVYPKLTPQELQKCEHEVFDLLNQLRKLDEKEEIRRRKQEEEKRLQAELSAKELHQRLEKEYQEKLKKELEDRKKKEDEALKCISCKEVINGANFLFLLEDCGHTMHKTCAKEYIVKMIEDKKAPITCLSCKLELNMNEIKALASGRQYKQYEELTFKLYMNEYSKDLSSCPTIKCSYMAELEDGVHQLDCPSCRRSYCLNCRNIGHPGRGCFVNAFATFAVFKGLKLKYCPNCMIMTEKKDGKMIRCQCTNFFCFFCGQQGGGCDC